MRRRSYIAAALAVLALGASAASAAAETPPPEVTATWVTSVAATSANLRGEINPAGFATSYRFEYITEDAFLDTGFTDADRVPTGNEAFIGSSGLPIAVVQHLGGLQPDTAYRYRLVATNSGGVTPGPARPLTTPRPPRAPRCPTTASWEMVSLVDKNGGEIQSFGGILGGAVIQAAAQGDAITYSSASAFGDPKGAPGGSQYVSTRGQSAWTTENVTLPMISGSYPESPDSGVPYQLFSTDLTSALLSNGRRCLSCASSQCPVANAPLPGSDAPAGYRNYYVRSGSDGSFKALLSSADIASLALGPEDFELAFAGATPDLAHVILSTCAALTGGATEVPGSEGECDPTKQNLYEKSGSELSLINTAPGARLAAQSRAISPDGSRVYWTDGTNLHLWDGGVTKQVDEGLGGGGTFETASLDGSVAFFSKEGHLWRYVVATGTATDLTPFGGVQGVLGASDDGSRVYYVKASGIFLWSSGKVTPVGSGADAGSYPPTTGNARVSADGRHLVFVSSDFEPSGYDNRNIKTGVLEPEVYLFTAPGPGTIPGPPRLRLLQPLRGKAGRRREPPGREPQRKRLRRLQAARALGRLASTSSSTASTRWRRRTPTTSGRVRVGGLRHRRLHQVRRLRQPDFEWAGRRRRLLRRRHQRRHRRLLPHRRLTRPGRPRPGRRLRRPGGRWPPGGARPDPVLRRRLPGAASRTRRPDPRLAALEALRQPAAAGP